MIIDLRQPKRPQSSDARHAQSVAIAPERLELVDGSIWPALTFVAAVMLSFMLLATVSG